MSICESTIYTSTQKTLQAVFEWLVEFSGFCEGNFSDGSPRQICRSTDSAITCILMDLASRGRGVQLNNFHELGSLTTITIDVNIDRSNAVGRLDDIYAIAFGFCEWDPDCNVMLRLDDANKGVFLRRDGVFYVNETQFYAKSLSAFLSMPYKRPDDANQLVMQEWPYDPPSELDPQQ